EERIGGQSLAVNPTTQVLWGASRDYYWEDALNGTIIKHSYPFTQAHNSPKITFTPDGNLYFFGCEDKSPGEPDPGIYHVDPETNTFTEILDLAGTPYACGVGSFTGAADGNIYWLLSDLLRISPSGVSQVWAVIPGGDPLGITHDPVTNDIYFGNGAGVFRIFEAENIYLPLVAQ
ncbi:MAG: hypothetical protein GXP38_11930, partial [Chloroflexi bacterium]|nr:hypothetical protein [Chloroflexota bacterium]